MAFVPWKDRVTSTPHRYKLTEVSADTYDLEAVPGTIGEAGTPVNAENLNKLIQRDGDDIKDTVTTFTEASTRANIGTGESTATLFGKIKKWFADLKPHAFNDLATTLGTETDKAPTNKLLNDTAALKANTADLKPHAFTTPSATQSTSADTVPSNKLLTESTFTRVYRSFAQLGIPNSSTIAEIHAAMIDRSKALIPVSTYAHALYGNTGLELPNDFFYVLEAIRSDNERLTLKLVGKAPNSDVLYHYEGMYRDYGTTDKFTGWKRIINDEDAQTITGVKTFATGATPLITDAPTTDLMAVNKAYADNLIPYDKVIRTQAEFNELIASPTWLGAESVALVGQFTYSTANNSGIKVPATVKQIHGFNSAKITITNFKYNSSTANGGLWYDTLPQTDDYSIRDLEVDCTGTGTGGLGFRNCTNLTNCTGTGTGTGSESFSFGFNNCTNLTNCTGTGAGTGTGNTGYGFDNCTNLTNCTGTGTGTYGYGFYYCTNLTNCTGKGTGTGLAGCGFYYCTNLTNCTGTGTGANGYGFNLCTKLTNCTGTGTGTTNGYGFRNITYASNCKDGGSSTAMWGGDNKNINVETCRKTPVEADNTELNA